MAQSTPRVPLAGKPPFATDDPDSLFEQSPQPQRRIRQQAEANPNDRTSTYNVYDQYLDDAQPNRQSGLGALGMNMLGLKVDHENTNPFLTHDKHAALAAAINPPQPNINPIPLAAPRPGYPAPIAALNLSHPTPTPSGQPAPQMTYVNQGGSNFLPSNMATPRVPLPAYTYNSSPTMTMPAVPSSPHPLLPPITPITPVFVRPSKSPAPRDIKFVPDTIIRGNSEDMLIPKRGEKGDDFWRRFSMVAKEENQKPSSQKISPWLRKTQNGTTSLSRWVWFIAIILLLCIGGAIGLGWYLSHNTPPNQDPRTFGGKSNETSAAVPSATGPAADLSSSRHVSPTHTVARRADTDPAPTGKAAIFDYDVHESGRTNTSGDSIRRIRKHVNRHNHH